MKRTRLLLVLAILCAPAVVAGDTFTGDPFDLELAWQVPIGSGYSGIAVSGERVVTAFTENDSDWVAAFDAGTGERRWRRELGAAHRGQDGADDGPLSSPVIGDGRVYVLAPAGRLLALRLSNGEVVWEKRIDEEFEAKAPHFGFTTTPLVAGDVLVLQTGGAEGRSVVGLEAKTGKQLWAVGDDEVQYQSPALMTLAGTLQVVTVDAKSIRGIAPGDGTVLWTHALGEGDRANSSTPAFIEDDRFLLFISGKAAAFRVSRKGAEYRIEELYRSDALGQNYAPPVYHDGHLYGFRGQVLACANAATGERVWRSRPPGGDGLILVDEHLVIFAAKGNVVVAEASPEGYRERARVQALEGSGLTWPSFAAGRIFVRNLSTMAAVTVTASAEAKKAESERAATQFGSWVQTTRRENDPQALVDEFWRRHAELPLVERDWVHFIYRSDAEDVAIVGSMIDSESADSMERLGDTDLYYRSYRLSPGTRWEYRFVVDFEKIEPDPRNPRRVPAVEGDDPFSELVLEGYELETAHEEPSGERGRIESFGFASDALGWEKQVEVWLPPSYGEGDAAYAVLIVTDGPAWLERGKLANTLDNVVGGTVRPVIVAFVDSSRRWWLEAGGSRTDDYVEMIAGELVPELRERYRIVDRRGAHGIMGNRFYAFSAAYAAVKHPEIFGTAIAQSPYTGLGHMPQLEELVRAADGSSVRFYLDWNRWDDRNVDRDYDLAEDGRALLALLRGAGFRVDGGEMSDSHGWGAWRNRSAAVLASAFPK